MTPDWRLLADRVDVTERLRDRLLSLSVTDEAGMDSDALEIVLDNRDGAIAPPRKGAELTLALGFVADGLVDMGLFVADEVKSSGPVRQITISAKAANVRAAFKAPRTRSWDATTVGALVTQVALENGLVPVVAPTLAVMPIQHLDQTAESDMALITRLARQYDAVGKPAHGRLIFVPRGEAKTASGLTLAAAAIDGARDGVTSWTATWADRGGYTAVIAHWHDDASAERRAVTIAAADTGPDDGVTSGPGATLTLPHDYPTEAEARAAAGAKLAAAARGKAKLSLTLPGRIHLAAEMRLTTSGLDAMADGLWTVTKVTHDLGAAGLVTSIEAEGVNG